MTLDVLSSPAVALVRQLAQDGFALAAVGDRILIRPASRVTPEVRTQLQRQRSDVLALLRVCDEAVAARWERFHRQLTSASPQALTALVFTKAVPHVPGACLSCGEATGQRTYTRCWRCALAWRLAYGLAIPAVLATAIDTALEIA